MHDDVLLKVEGLSKNYGGVFAVRGVSFELRRGEVLGLIGPNGAGKSTLFNLVSGIVPPSEGAIYLEGRALHRLRPNEVCARGAARTFQSASLLAGMTVWENVHVASLFRPRERQGGMSAEQCTRRALALCDLADAARRPAERLTVSEQKRVEIARALATNPLLIMTDEVLAGLNPAEGDEVLCILRQINGEGISIIFVEHDVRAVVRLCDRVVVLAQGAKLSEGPPDEVVRDPAVIEVYLGSRYASRH
jgi:branched-chain amino acid transport system ATP-binding protein